MLTRVLDSLVGDNSAEPARTMTQANLALFEYIDGFHNPRRTQKRLGRLEPIGGSSRPVRSIPTEEGGRWRRPGAEETHTPTPFPQEVLV
jgi:hypothetical protein